MSKIKTSTNLCRLGALIIAGVLLIVTGITVFGWNRAHADAGDWLSATSNPTLSRIRDLPSGTVWSDEPTVDTSRNIDCVNLTIKIDNTNTRSSCMVQGEVGRQGSASGTNYLLINGATKAGTMPYSLVPNSDRSYSTPYNGSGSYYIYWQHTAANLKANAPSSSGAFTYSYKNNYDGYAKDANNNKIYTNTQSLGYSNNGEWAVYDYPYKAMVRVNLETMEVVPFAPSVNSQTGYNSNVFTAISDDGRYAFVSYRQSSYVSVKIYDLSTCPTSIPATITGPVSCQSKDLTSFFGTQFSNFHAAYQARFMSDDLINLFVRYNYVGGSYTVSKYSMYAPGVTPPSGANYLALGDSFASGEGAYDYQVGTDDQQHNLCHNSKNSYPYLIASQLSISNFHSVACSSARTEDITLRIQHSTVPAVNPLGNWLPGVRKQVDAVRDAQPNVITVMDGGNDIGFAGIVSKCVKESNTCYSTHSERVLLANTINQKFGVLTGMYQDLLSQSHGAKVYVLGYPQVVSPTGTCASNTGLLDSQEMVFANYLVSYLNYVIKLAAQNAGVTYVDTENALQGHRLCETESRNIAVNGVVAGNDIAAAGFKVLGAESFHPNKLGHALLASTVRSATSDFTLLNPAPVSKSPPTITDTDQALANLLSVSGTDTTLESLVPNDDNPNQVVFSGNILTYAWSLASHPEIMLAPSSSFHAYLNSTPVDVGTFTSDADGNLSASITIPSGTTPGIHALDLHGTNLAGDPIDIMSTVYVGASTTDLDGDGVPDSTDSCPSVSNSGVDDDQNGVDDACQGYVDTPPLYQAINGDSALGQDPTKIYIERKVATAVSLGINDYNPTSADWVVIGQTTSSDDASSAVASFTVEDRGLGYTDDTERYLPLLSTRTGDSGCVQLTPASLAAKTSTSTTAMTEVAANTNTCRSQPYTADADNNGTPDYQQPLYRARMGNASAGEDPTKIYIERNLYASEAILGISDYTQDADGWAVVGVSGSVIGAINKIVLEDSSGTSVLSDDGTVTTTMLSSLTAADLQSVKPLILVSNGGVCSAITPTSLTVVKSTEIRSTDNATMPAGLACD